MPKRKEPELDPKEQFKRFKEAAKQAEVDPDVAARTFKTLTKPTSKSSAKD